MYTSFEQIRAAAEARGRKTISVAVAQDEDVLTALKQAEEAGLSRAVLVGRASAIEPLVEKAGLNDYEIVDEPDDDEAALKAADLVRLGRAGVLMKGMINSGNFLKAVLNRERGLRKSPLLCHLGVFEVPGFPRLMFHSDGGMNVAPGLEEKKEILISVLKVMADMGYQRPNVAVLSHNEQVNPKMPSTTDAAALVRLAEEGLLPPCNIEGPMAMDVAASRQAAEHKKITGKISGEVDFFLMPSIEAGNITGKALIYYAGARFAGLVVGAAAPVIMASRSDSPAAKLDSISLACLAAS